MEKAKEERKLARRRFTLCAKQIEEALAESDVSVFCALIEKLTHLFENLCTIQNRIYSIWLEQSDRDEPLFDKDISEAEEYSTTFYILKQKVKDATAQSDSSKKGSVKEFGSCVNSPSGSSDVKQQRRFRLKSLELKRFDGQVGTWIPFWSQFRKIHMDETIEDDDKFQYLLQAMEHGSSAQELVASFPPTGANYAKAIDHLRERFARDELIIEHYVREMLQLVLAQSGGTSKLSLRSLYDKLMSQILALESLGVTQDKYTAFLFPLVESALPVDILRAWNRSHLYTNSKANPLTEILDFVKREVESDERIRVARFGFKDDSPVLPTAACFATATDKRDFSSKDTTRKTEKTCLWCDKTLHNSSECVVAVKMSLDERKDFLKRKNACFICLNIGHVWKKCKKYPKCVICGKRHYPIMCSDICSKQTKEDNSSDNFKSKQTVMNQSDVTSSKTVLLQTLKVNISNGRDVLCLRALCDTGAQQSFLKKEVAVKLNLKPCYQQQLSHNLFGGVITKKQNYNVYNINIESLNGKYKCNMEVFEEEKICGYLPTLQKDSIIFSQLLLKGINVTDCVNDVSEISLLIGCDILGSLYTGRSVRVDDNLLAVETKLGWTIQGPAVGVYCSVGNVNSLACTFDIEDIWNLETIGIKDDSGVKSRRSIQNDVDVFFKNTVIFNEENRYEVKLPWKDLSICLPSNYGNALKRLYSTTAKLSRLGITREYDYCFKEWHDSGIIEKVEDADIEKGYYLPHHAVVKESSLTTKIRPVFDASSSKKGELSLNQCLEKGTNLIELIPPLLVKFRKNAIGITADIKKAFLQISLYPEDRDFLKFLWWRNIDEVGGEILTFRHRRVTFGVTTSPYLLSATILHHLERYDSDTASILKDSFYVDNCVTSVSTVDKMYQFIDEAKSIMLEGNFELRCWVTGPEIIDKDINTVSVLGLTWDPKADVLFCKIPVLGNINVLTKRSVMSLAHSIFDPIGYLCPAMLIPKLLVQKCWLANLSWDEALSSDLEIIMKDWLSKIKFLEDCRIPRRISCYDLQKSNNSLHIFADSSQSAYAACIFLRSKFENKVTVQLISAKSRVAPTKAVTMPRLELIAAVLATRLAVEVDSGLEINCKRFYWTDSSIVLAWINRNACLNVFVHNRVKEILAKSDADDWHHISGPLNPADLPSRGCKPDVLLKSKWWEGPEWLKRPHSEWPKSCSVPDEVEFQKEVIKNCLTVQDSEIFSERFTYFGKYSKIIRTIGWCLRFYEICRNKSNTKKSDLNSEEFMCAEKRLIRLLQMENFDCSGDFIKNLRIETFRDEDNLIRVRTRLTMSDDSHTFISPILLPNKNVIVERLVIQKHNERHAGSQTLINLLRENYWIVGIRCLAKRVVRQCPICRRYAAKPCTAPPPPLPLDRIRCGSVFEVTGIDLGGPLILKDGSKCWIVLFTCATYRAVHLELCTSLSTEDFLLSLRRFLARRGSVKIIYSDNGTNFRGTSNLLNQIDWKELSDKTSVQKIVWRHIPPASAWWGGFWERMIRSLKDILRRILGRAALQYAELSTVLCEAESLLNSRPLTYICDDTENLKALTPAMFLKVDANVDDSRHAIFDHLDGNVLTARWKYLVKLSRDLKERFRSEYLSLLTQKRDCKKVHEQIKVGDVVLIGSDDLKRVNWPLGLVQDIYPGIDGRSRVARVRTAQGDRVRPVQRLFPLELRSVHTIAEPEPTTPKVTTRTGRLVRIPTRLGF